MLSHFNDVTIREGEFLFQSGSGSLIGLGDGKPTNDKAIHVGVRKSTPTYGLLLQPCDALQSIFSRIEPFWMLIGPARVDLFLLALPLEPHPFSPHHI